MLGTGIQFLGTLVSRPTRLIMPHPHEDPNGIDFDQRWGRIAYNPLIVLAA
jgi:hypothetical protein